MNEVLVRCDWIGPQERLPRVRMSTRVQPAIVCLSDDGSSLEEGECTPSDQDDSNLIPASSREVDCVTPPQDFITHNTETSEASDSGEMDYDIPSDFTVVDYSPIQSRYTSMRARTQTLRGREDDELEFWHDVDTGPAFFVTPPEEEEIIDQAVLYWMIYSRATVFLLSPRVDDYLPILIHEDQGIEADNRFAAVVPTRPDPRRPSAFETVRRLNVIALNPSLMQGLETLRKFVLLTLS